MLKTNVAALLLVLLLALPASAIEPMKITYFDRYPPRSWLEKGEMKGILIDIISEALEKRLGIPLLHEGYPWARAQAMVENGLADAFITVPTEKRKAYTFVSQEPVIRFNIYIATQKDNPKLDQLRKVRTFDDLKPFTMVDYNGNGFSEKRLKDHNVEWVPDVAAVYPFLASGKADALLVSDRGSYDLQHLGYQDRLIVLPQSLHTLAFHLCIGKNSPFVKWLPQIDKVLKQMRKEGLMQKISAHYYQ